MKKKAREILLLLCASLFALGLADLKAEPAADFVGRWYSKPDGGGIRYDYADVFLAVEVRADHTFAIAYFSYDPKQDPKEVVEHGREEGIATEAEDGLKCQYQNSQPLCLLIKNLGGTLEMQDLRGKQSGSKTILLPPDQAPWSKYKIAPATK